MFDAEGYALAAALVSLLLAVGGATVDKRKQITPAEHNSTTGWRRQAIRFLYFIGLPYSTVLLGIVTPRFLGLAGLEYFAAIDWGGASRAIQLQQALTLFLLRLLFDAPVTILAGTAALLLLGAVWLVLVRSGAALVFRPRSGLDVLYDAVHWAFYRAIFWVVTADLYLGTVLGVGWVLVEQSGVIWPERHQPRRQQQFLVQTSLLLLTAAVFYYSPNLWLLLPLHLVMASLVKQIPSDASPRFTPGSKQV